MIQLSINDVNGLLSSILNDNSIYSNAINRNTPTSIGVFSAPESRMGNVLTLGGDECAPIKPIPVNILVRWTDDSVVCEAKAKEVYQALKNLSQNYIFRPTNSQAIKISHINLLDMSPVWLGRDKDNVCEFSIRADIFYYLHDYE